MAGHGPAPKEHLSRASHDRHRQDEITKLEATGETYGPELPDEIKWPARTRRWWETWRTSAMAQTLTDTDWDFLLDTALLHAEFWSGNTAGAAELRLRVAKFGATPEDRMRLKIQIGKPGAKKAPKASPPVDDKDRRSRLLHAVNGE